MSPQHFRAPLQPLPVQAPPKQVRGTSEHPNTVPHVFPSVLREQGSVRSTVVHVPPEQTWSVQCRSPVCTHAIPYTQASHVEVPQVVPSVVREQVPDSVRSLATHAPSTQS